jgi:two-component system nitrogen regulation response regulator GlnG
MNLAAAPRDRVDSELFGRGEGDAGKIAEADGGTLFLDEIGDMPLDAQTRLLRIFDGADTALNPKTGRRSNVRVIAASNRELRGLIQQGLFREDLYFRINVAPIRLPPLRERLEDVPDLARHFLVRAHREGLPSKTIDQAAIERLKSHPWPGNVRELENLIRRICALYPEPMVTARIIDLELSESVVPGGKALGVASLSEIVCDHLTGYFASQPGGSPPDGLFDRVMAEVERPLIKLTLAATRGNQLRAARMLGLNRNTLRKRIHDLDIAFERPRP